MSDPLSRLLLAQAGVISRAQLLDLGERPKDVERRIRRRELTPLHLGVYVEHTGAPTWLQRAWGGVLRYEPAALDGLSALRADLGPGLRRHPDGGAVRVAVDRSRNRRPEPGVDLRRVTHLDEIVRWNLSPPRLRVEEAALAAAAEADPVEAVAVLAEVVQGRLTTPERLRQALAAQARMPRRRWLTSILDDLASGVCSTLESGYLSRVERAHGLPRGRRQTEDHLFGRVHRRDVDYGILVVELDGRAFHDSAGQRERDLDRDLDLAAARGTPTVRLGYGQVFERACRTATRIASVLRRAGWSGHPYRCGTTCALDMSAADSPHQMG